MAEAETVTTKANQRVKTEKKIKTTTGNPWPLKITWQTSSLETQEIYLKTQCVCWRPRHNFAWESQCLPNRLTVWTSNGHISEQYASNWNFDKLYLYCQQFWEYRANFQIPWILKGFSLNYIRVSYFCPCKPIPKCGVVGD